MGATSDPPTAHATPVLTRRTLAASPYHGPAAETYKCDARSCVWRVTLAGEPAEAPGYVVKRFEYAPLRQRLALTLGVHPAQRELRWNRTLQAAGVPAVPIVDAGFERGPARAAPHEPGEMGGRSGTGGTGHGPGCRVWLVTPWLGESLQRLIRDANVPEARRREAVAAAAALTHTLLRAGFTFRDLKPSNIVIDAAGAAHLLDVGSVGATTAPRRVARMLATMDRVMRRDGADEALRRAFAERVDHPAGAAGAESDRAARRP